MGTYHQGPGIQLIGRSKLEQKSKLENLRKLSLVVLGCLGKCWPFLVTHPKNVGYFLGTFFLKIWRDSWRSKILNGQWLHNACWLMIGSGVIHLPFIPRELHNPWIGDPESNQPVHWMTNHAVFGSKSITGWWFGTFFIFPYNGNNNPNWPIFFRGAGQPPIR